MEKFDLPQRPWTLTAERCLEELRVEAGLGLTDQEADRRLKEFGKNVLPAKKRKWIGLVFLEQFYSPLVGLLIVSGAIIEWMGSFGDACVVWAVVILNAIMGTIQEGRAERSISELRKLAAPRARVLRGKEEKVLDASLLVPGDIVLLSAGDAVPADLRVIESAVVEVVESILTGESAAVAKTSAPIASAEALYEKANMLFSGTHLTKGRCKGVVTAVGAQSEIGKIAQLVETIPEPRTPIENKIGEFGRHLIVAAIIIFILFFGIGYLQKLPLKEIFLAAVSQLVSIIPEGLPVAITIAMAVGVQRMAKKGALIRRIHAVETLGSTTVICSDKTGTLTRNEMTVVEVALPGKPLIPVNDLSRSSDLDSLLTSCILCNDANPPIGDPMEKSLLALAAKAGYNVEEGRKKYPRLGEVPFDPAYKMMATYHEGFAIIKGALEEVLALCPKAAKEQIEYEAHVAALKGRRIIGFARASGNFREEEGIVGVLGKSEFLGFTAIIDPPRDEVPEAISLCQKAHIRTTMLTGDHLTTAMAIAQELGLVREGDIGVDGKQLAAYSKEEFAIMCDHIAVYARLQPEQKHYVVQTLQEKGHVVAMTGDGVNDAPALAKADVGVAMGSGTDVAKGASKVILTDDSFATLVRAIEQGRLVYRNIVKVVVYLLGTTLAAALVMILAVTLGYPLPMAAVQILWINVVTEGTMTINLVLDPPDGTEMDTPPFKKTDPILSRTNILKLLWTIVLIGGILFGYFLYTYSMHYSQTLIQTEIFTLLAICAWFKLLTTRSETRSALTMDFLKNRYLVFGLLLSILLQIAVIYWSRLNSIFHTTPLTGREIIRILLLGSVVLWAEELRKWFARHYLKRD